MAAPPPFTCTLKKNSANAYSSAQDKRLYSSRNHCRLGKSFIQFYINFIYIFHLNCTVFLLLMSTVFVQFIQ